MLSGTVVMRDGNAKFQPSVLLSSVQLQEPTSIEDDRLGRREFGISPASDNMVPVQIRAK